MPRKLAKAPLQPQPQLVMQACQAQLLDQALLHYLLQQALE
jgi:hypothetical protein